MNLQIRTPLAIRSPIPGFRCWQPVGIGDPVPGVVGGGSLNQNAVEVSS